MSNRQKTKTTMSFTNPPLRKQTSEPVLRVGGMAWDLSNLCSIQNESNSLPSSRRLDRTQSHRRQTRREQSMYPNREDLVRYLPADIDTFDIFDRSRFLRGPPGRDIEYRTQSLPPTGANIEFDQLHGLSSIYNDRCFHPLSRDPPSARDVNEFRDCNSEAQEGNYSLWEHGCSHSEEARNEPPPIPVSISDCSSDVSSLQCSRACMEGEETSKPVQVEIYPGEFLQLRGAKETFAAVERGHSRSVFCYACGLGLRCVADCELVICPDCRIMSPVPRRRPACLFENSKCEDDRGSLPQFTPPLWRDEDDVAFYTSKQKSNMRSRNGSSRVRVIGGVGLGLKIEH